MVIALLPAAITALFAQTAKQRREFERDDQGGQQKREEWFYRQRAYPFDRIPKGARLKAWQQKLAIQREMQGRSMRALSDRVATPAATAAWSFIGPQDNNFWGGNSSGRITSLAVDPRNSQVVWTGAADGGVWKTTDGGQHWTPMTDNQPSLSIGAIALDPAHPDTIYVGTGETNSNIDTYSGAGLLKSTDGGATWVNIPGPFAGNDIGAIAVNPANSQLVLASSTGGVFRSTDGGATWTNVLKGVQGYTVAFNPASPSQAWAGIGYIWGDSADGVYESTDGGQTWSLVTGTAPNSLPPASQIGRVAVVLSPSKPSTVFAGVSPVIGGNNPNNSSDGTGLYRSDDGGKNWTLMAQPGYSPNWFENTLAVSPTDPSLLVGGGSPLMVSTDGGRTWANEPPYIHPDQHAVAFSQDGSVVYIGNDGGVYSTIDIANPQAAWLDLNATLGVTQFYPGMSLNPADLRVAIAGTQDNGTLLYSGSLLWTWVSCGDGGATAIDPVNPKNIYIACVTGPAVAKSTDGGLSNSDMSQGFDKAEGFPWPPYIAIDPTNPSNLYYTGNKRIYQTTNGAASWQAISGDLTNGGGSPAVIAVAPSDSNTVYAGTQSGVLWATRNALSGVGATWTNHTNGLPRRFITGIAVDQSNPSLAYVTLSGFGSGHVFVTGDAGSTWQDISGNLPDAPTNDLALDPDLDGTLYAGTDAGIFVTSNHGISWAPLGTGLPNAVVSGVRFHSATRTLRVSTHGRGMWDLALPLPALALVSPGGIVNAASYGQTSGSAVLNTAISPGSIAAVFGTSMANVPQAFAGSIPLPTQLGGASLSIAGIPAPQFFASRNQLNVQIPWEVPVGTTNATLSLGLNTAYGQVQVVPFLPGIFTANASGKGQGIIVHANSATLVAPTGTFGASYPAAKGEVLTLYATGLGPVDHQPVTGQATPGDPLARTMATPSVTVGNVDAPVSFSGLSPGLVGLYQVNFEVPDGAPAGDYVPVALSIGGAVSNAATLAIAIPEIDEPAGGFPQSCSMPLAVPFPVLISGTLLQNQGYCFSISFPQITKVHFTLTGLDSFAGWLFLLNQDLSWRSYVYVATPNSGSLDATLAAGTWVFSVGWNNQSAAGPYKLLVEEPAP